MRIRFYIMLGIVSGIIYWGCQRKSQTTSIEKTVKSPNIIYILADDMGYADLGVYGQKTIQTPTFDRLAAEGIYFTQHYAGSTVCAPSRASLMTGKHTGTCYVRGNYEDGPRGFGAELELRPEDLTLAEVLKQADYKTAVIGKWGMGMDSTTGEPNKKGFDYAYGLLNQAYAHYQFPEKVFRNGKEEFVPENKGGKRGAYSGDLYTQEALRYIRKNAGNKFFIYLAYTTPHAEMLVPEDSVFLKYKGKFKESPFVMKEQGGDDSGLGAYQSQEYPKAAYAAMVNKMDNDLALILAELKRQGVDDNTLICFSSDNGPHKEGGANPEYFNSNGALRGAKRDLYEGGIRVPFIMRWPAAIKAGQVSNHVSAFWDILPTLADIAGLSSAMYKTDGISFFPTLTNKESLQKQHPYLYWEFHEAKYSHQAVRKGNWKAVRLDPAKSIELYNLETDISEKTNVANKYPDVVKEMTHLLNNTRTEHPIWSLKASK